MVVYQKWQISGMLFCSLKVYRNNKRGNVFTESVQRNSLFLLFLDTLDIQRILIFVLYSKDFTVFLFLISPWYFLSQRTGGGWGRWGRRPWWGWWSQAWRGSPIDREKKLYFPGGKNIFAWWRKTIFAWWKKTIFAWWKNLYLLFGEKPTFAWWKKNLYLLGGEKPIFA